MIDHLSLPLADIERGRRFYDAVMAALGQQRVKDIAVEDHVTSGYGSAPDSEIEPMFWIGAPLVALTSLPAGRDGLHIAFKAASRAMVDAFHAAAMAAGGTDNGAPGVRPHYHEHYYAAFVIDLDGNAIEAVCHDPAEAA